MGLLNTSLIDRTSGLAFGCVGLAIGGVASLPVTTMALGTLGALAFAARAKHGTDSRTVIRRISRRLRDTRRKDQQYGYAEQDELDRIAKAFVKASDGAMLSAEDLATLSVTPDMSGFPEAASSIILTAIGKANPQFAEDGLAREFAQDALAEALRAAIEDADYFKKLEPHLLIRTAESMGTVLAFLERMEADAIQKGRQLDEMQDTLERFADERLPEKLLIRLVRKVDDSSGDNAEAIVTNLLGRLEATEALIEEGRTASNLPDSVDAVEKRIADQVEAGEFDAADHIAIDALSEWRDQQEAQTAAGASLIDAAIRTARLNADDLGVAADRIAALECEKLTVKHGHLHAVASAHRLSDYRERIELRADGLDVQIALRLVDRVTLNLPSGEDAAAINDSCGSLHARLNALGLSGQLDLAISAFRRALEERTQDRVPLDWATTQNNLGNAYLTKAERGDDAALDLAITAYELALEERTQDRVPLDWAMTQLNLGNAEIFRAKLKRDFDLLRSAIQRRARAPNLSETWPSSSR